ncbi:MAG TPA: hypothetical protein VK886_20110 [Vicinamibacterales bacterium]|nr:hypothetical protein [Vicinamibacterales bacterium]
MTRRGFEAHRTGPMGNFYKQAEKFQAVCREHTHVLEPDSTVVVFSKKKRADG